jgi:hypothetical protein
MIQQNKLSAQKSNSNTAGFYYAKKNVYIKNSVKIPKG